MNYPHETCCLCLSVTNAPFTSILAKCEKDITHHRKIIATLSQLGALIDTDMDFMLCKICCKTIEMIYAFNETCLLNIKVLSNYKVITNSIKSKENAFIKSNSTHINRDPSVCTVENKILEKPKEPICIKEEIEEIISSDENETGNFSKQMDTEILDIKPDIDGISEIKEEPDLQGTENGEDYLETMDYSSLESTETEITKNTYIKEYNQFKQWCRMKGCYTVDENILLMYFQEISRSIQSPTQLGLFYKLKATLSIKENIDISRYESLKKFLKQKSVKHTPNKSKAFTKTEIDAFLTQAPDDMYLSKKAILVVGVACGCEKRELSKITIDDVTIEEETIIITMATGDNGICKKFYILDPLWVSTIKKYLLDRPTGIVKLFIKYTNGKHCRQNIGHNTMGQVPSIVADYLKLDEPKRYTGRSLRQSSQVLRRLGTAFFQLK